MTKLNNVVLSRIIIPFSTAFNDSFDEDVALHMEKVYRAPTCVWAKNIGAKITIQRMMGDLEAEIVIFAELTAQQTTEFILRFA